MSTVEIAAELQTVGGGLSAGARPRPAADLRQRAGRRARPAPGDPGRGARPARRTRPTRSPPSGTGWSTASRSPRASPPTWPAWRCCSGCTASTRTRCRRRTPDAGRARSARRSCARCTPSGCTRPARRSCSSATSRPEQALDAAERALGSLDRRRQATVDLPPAPALEPGPLLLVDRPGSVQSSLRMALPAVPAHAPRPRRAAAGQPGLRRLLLVPLGGEHPRGQGLHVRAALGDRALGRRLGAGRRGRGGHRGDRRRRCWRRCTSWAGWPRLPPGEDELEQARQYALGTLQLGMSTQAGLAGLASTYAGFGLRLDYLAEHAGRLAAATRDDVAAAAAQVPRAGRRGRPSCSATPRRSRRRWPRCVRWSWNDGGPPSPERR